MANNPEEYCKLRREFIEAAAKYEPAKYQTFIQKTARSEEGYYESGQYDCVALIKWPYRPRRKCWILAPHSGTNEEPFSTMKVLFSKAWLWLPRVIAERVVDAAEEHLSPPADLGLYWARSHYQLWGWLLWFDWLWRCGEVETGEPEVQSEGMDLSPFSCSADLIARWGLDGSADTVPVWLGELVVRREGRGKGKRRGRKKATYATVKREEKLAADWQQARESGTSKAVFAKDNEMNLKEFEKLLNRVRKRKTRSDN